MFYKSSQWLESNHGPLVSEATTQSNVPQPLHLLTLFKPKFLHLSTRRHRAHGNAKRARRVRERLLRGQVVRKSLHVDVAFYPANEVVLLDEASSPERRVCVPPRCDVIVHNSRLDGSKFSSPTLQADVSGRPQLESVSVFHMQTHGKLNI